MSESRNNYKKVDIHLELINELRKRYMTRQDIRDFLSARYISYGKVPSKIANVFDYKVCERTVKRELESIADKYQDQLDYVNGAYKLDLNDFPDTLDETEIQALEIAIQKISYNKNAQNILKNLKAKLTTKLYNKINRVELKNTATRKINEIDQKVNVNFAYIGPHHITMFDTNVKSVLDSAIINLHEVEFMYKTNKKLVQPLGILYGPNNVYLIAYPKDDDKPWHYILSDIKNAVETDISFDPGDFSIQEYANSMFGIYDEGKVYNVEWLVKDPNIIKIVKQYQFHPTQKLITNTDGTLTIKMRTGGLRAMSIYLTQWRGDIIPIKPKELLIEYRNLLKRCEKSIEDIK